MAATSVEPGSMTGGPSPGQRADLKSLFAKAARAVRLVGARRPADRRVEALAGALGRPAR